ncbi:hypothetical protein HA402_002201 [Bradysia odoriphaga]|nr:hypothetical protein HA402_002201 [Bradysia odoriphaga]
MSVEPSEIDRALKKNSFGYHQMFNNTTPVSQKRQIEERSESPRKRVYFDSDRTSATDTATEHRNELSLAEAGSKGEQTIIGDRLREIERSERQGNSAEIEAHTDNPNSTEPILIDLSDSTNVNDDCEADKEDECGRSENPDDDSDAANKSPNDE